MVVVGMGQERWDEGLVRAGKFFLGGGKEEVDFRVIGDFFLIVLGMAWRRCILSGARVGDLDVGSFDKEIFWS